MKLKLALATALLVTGASAYAVDHNLGQVSASSVLYTFLDPVVGNDSVSYTFELLSSGSVAGGYSGIPTPVLGSNNSFLGFVNSFLGASPALYLGGSLYAEDTTSSGGTFSFANLAAGVYTLQFLTFNGNLTGTSSQFFSKTGTFATTVQVTASAVPEPQTYALLLAAGLAVCFVGRRRNR